MDGGDKCLYRVLFDRFQTLEASHQKLKELFEVVLQGKTANASTITAREREVTSDSEDATSFPGWERIPDNCYPRSSYRSVLEHIGHAIHVSRIGSGEIIYWNRAAEKLYGYKDYEVVGRGIVGLLFDEEHHHLVMAIMERLSTGKSWSGQLPLKKRSGQSFMALVTKTLLYEDGELAGIVTVSSDAAVFNNTNSGNTRTRKENGNEQSRIRRITLKKIEWNPRTQIAAVPQLASSVSNLASKVLSWKREDATCDTHRNTRESEKAEVENHHARADRPPRAPIAKPAFSFSIGRSRTEAMNFEKEKSTSEFAQPPGTAVKFLQKLHIQAMSNSERDVDENIQQNNSEDKSMSNLQWNKQSANVGNSLECTSHIFNLDAGNHSEDSSGAFSIVYQRCSEMHRPANQLPRSSLQSDGSKFAANLPNMKPVNPEDAYPRHLNSHKVPSSGESFGHGPGISTSKGENDPHKLVNSVIHWEQLQLKEEIGQGAFAVVYRGVWNGSNVAVKVYTGNQYSEETLLDYKKEIDIMRRLRHQNVLLFMGAICTEERIAIVTEHMTRGSLFKTLHRNNQPLDIRRRLRMAIDVARGMNYLHHRNPPIVHRDLKSSNLLVDKSWTVKVADFGSSKLKYATFLTARSGRGTPQWMAPEVLRNEPSTKKSDIFSFGVILWELMTGKIPWSNLNSLQVVGAVGFMDCRLDLPDNIDPQVSSIISDCWKSNPEDRPSFKDIIHNMTNLFNSSTP